MEREKSMWGNPMVITQEFVPQEYVAICEDRDTWGATCVTMASHNRGYIFYDHDMDGSIDDEDLVSDGRSEHGGCGRTHYFHSPTRPDFNGWVLSESTMGSYGITHYADREGDHYRLKAQYKDMLTPALIKKPGEVFDNNWLVCIDLADLRNPS